MKFYIQKTNRRYCPEIRHPVGKFCLEFLEPDEFLLEKLGDEGYLTSGFPMPEYQKYIDGKLIGRTERKVQYFDSKEDAQKRIDTMIEGWRSGYKIIEVTENGLIYI